MLQRGHQQRFLEHDADGSFKPALAFAAKPIAGRQPRHRRSSCSLVEQGLVESAGGRPCSAELLGTLSQLLGPRRAGPTPWRSTLAEAGQDVVEARLALR